jgi:RNA polymerase sigma factor (sigma-70 family)
MISLTTTSPSGSDSSPHDAVGERALVAAAQTGDERAFATLYERHAPRVYALLTRLTGDDARAADLLQESFLSAWRALPHWRGDSALATWLHRIAVNAHLAELRARRRRDARESTEFELDMVAGIAAAGPDTATQIDLERAIAALPPRMRTAFVLRDVEGYSYDDIALITDTAPATIRAQVSRARMLLSRQLER